MNMPVLCGGAAINSNYINRIAKEGGIYSPGVFYCKTAFDGLKVMNRLMSPDREQFVNEWKQKLEKWDERHHPVMTVEQSQIPHSSIKPVEPPIPPHINRPTRLEPFGINLNEVWKYVNKKSLFVLQWGIRGRGASDQDPEKLFRRWKDRVISEKLFEPRAVYGFYKCHNLTLNQGGNGRLAIDLPDGKQVVFEFPRSSKEKHLCLADYFGENDIVAFQAVTVGNKVTEIIDLWNRQDRYADAYYLHGLAVERSEEHTSELQSRQYLVCRLLLEKKTKYIYPRPPPLLLLTLQHLTYLSCSTLLSLPLNPRIPNNTISFLFLLQAPTPKTFITRLP